MSEFLDRLHELYALSGYQLKELEAVVRQHKDLWPAPGQVWRLSVETVDKRELSLSVEVEFLHLSDGLVEVALCPLDNKAEQFILDMRELLLASPSFQSMVHHAI